MGSDSEQDLSKRFAKLCKDVSIAGATFHDLRRTFVTNLRRAGVDGITGAKLSGHKTLAVVQKHYSIVDSDDLREAWPSLKVEVQSQSPFGARRVR